MDKKLKLFMIFWEPAPGDCRKSIVIERDEERAINRLIKERAVFYNKYKIDSIDEIEMKEGILGHFWC